MIAHVNVTEAVGELSWSVGEKQYDTYYLTAV